MKKSEVRRKNREIVSDDMIRQHLEAFPFGFIATADNNQPFLNCNLFYFSAADHVVYFHTKAGGVLEQSLRTNDKACFAVGSMGRLLPSDNIHMFTTEYLSVVVFGRILVVRDPGKIMFVFRKYFAKYFSSFDVSKLEPFTIDDAQKATMFALHIDEWSCKSNSAVADFPGAFFYENVINEEYLRRFGKFFIHH